jgi:hypothetical protein
VRRKKRSSCASGSGNVPSCSIGFSVASSRKGSGSLAVDGDLVLGHRLEQRGLCLRHRAVDLVDEHDVGEDRARAELELAAALVEDREARDVRRLEVGRALDPRGRGTLDRLRDRAGEHRLGSSRDVLEQHVTPAGQRGEDELDLGALAVHDRLDVGDEAVRHRARLLEASGLDHAEVGHFVRTVNRVAFIAR